MRTRLADPGRVPRRVEDQIAVLVGAVSRDGLCVVASHADIVTFSPLRHGRGKPPGTLMSATAAQTDALVALLRQRANGRRLESDVLVQMGRLGRDPLAAAKAAIEHEAEGEDPHVLAESPCMLLARTAADAAAEIERRRERSRASHVCRLPPRLSRRCVVSSPDASR